MKIHLILFKNWKYVVKGLFGFYLFIYFYHSSLSFDRDFVKKKKSKKSNIAAKISKVVILITKILLEIERRFGKPI